MSFSDIIVDVKQINWAITNVNTHLFLTLRKWYIRIYADWAKSRQLMKQLSVLVGGNTNFNKLKWTTITWSFKAFTAAPELLLLTEEQLLTADGSYLPLPFKLYALDRFGSVSNCVYTQLWSKKIKDMFAGTESVDTLLKNGLFNLLLPTKTPRPIKKTKLEQQDEAHLCAPKQAFSPAISSETLKRKCYGSEIPQPSILTAS